MSVFGKRPSLGDFVLIDLRYEFGMRPNLRWRMLVGGGSFVQALCAIAEAHFEVDLNVSNTMNNFRE